MSSTREFGLPNLVPKTGQTTSYATGDDGALQKGRKTTPRYVDNGDGTVSDRITGLMWPKGPARMVTGTPGVFTQNQVQAAKGAWANNTVYSVGDMARDTSTLDNWVCKVGHTSPVLPSNWQASHAYTAGNVVKDPNTGLFWAAGGNFTSIATPSAWAAGTSYLTGDYVKDGSGNYYQATSDHTSVTQPATLSSGASYSNNDFVTGSDSNIYQAIGGQTALNWSDWTPGNFYATGDYVTGPDNQSWQSLMDHTASSDFSADVSNGDWSNLFGGPMDLYQLSNGSNWSNLGSNLFQAVELFTYTWTNTGVNTVFALDRTVHTWNSSADVYTFGAERSNNPTYWQQIYFSDIAGNLLDSGTKTFATVSALITTLNSEGYAGYTDWRWPNVLELGSLFEPVLNGINGYPSIFGINHLQTFSTSTSHPTNLATEYYGVQLNANGGFPYNAFFKTNALCIWPVRGG